MLEAAHKPKNTRDTTPAKTASGLSAKSVHDHHDTVQAVLRTNRIHAKLITGHTSDKYEQGVDAVSDKVMRTSDADVAQRVEVGGGTPLPPALQRKMNDSFDFGFHGRACARESLSDRRGRGGLH